MYSITGHNNIIIMISEKLMSVKYSALVSINLKSTR